MAPKRAKKVPDSASKTKKAKLDPLREKVNQIIEAVETHHEDPNIQQLLVNAAKTAFDDPKEKRHRFHEDFIKMIDTSLRKYIADFESQVAETKIKVNSADSIKAQNIENRDQIAEALEQKKEQIAKKQDEVKGREEEVKAATKEAKAKKADKAKACGPLMQLEEDLAECNKKFAGYTELRDNVASLSANQRKTGLKQLTPYLERIKLDDSLTHSVPLVLAKETRAGFDLQVLQEVEKQFSTFMDDLNGQIDNEKQSNAGIISELEAAERHLESTKQECDTAKEELSTLEGHKNELEKNKKTSEKDIKDHDKNVKEYVSELATLTKTHESLTKVYEVMVELRDRQSEKEEAPEQSEMQVCEDL